MLKMTRSDLPSRFRLSFPYVRELHAIATARHLAMLVAQRCGVCAAMRPTHASTTRIPEDR
jgi:hypothetical protein